VIWKVVGAGMTAKEAAARLREAGILTLDIGMNRIRAVCHLNVSVEDVEYAAETVLKLFG